MAFRIDTADATFSAQEDVQMVFSSILDDEDTRIAIHDFKQSSFSYNVPGERGFAEISGYLLASTCITEINGQYLDIL